MNRNNEDDNDEEKIGDSATKLKGVLWPGMNLFDSATPEMKRMRNQRKDGNVLEQMMATSADIEPSEVSYFADGQFRASRDIFGPPSCETSPVCIPTPSCRWLSISIFFGTRRLLIYIPRSRRRNNRQRNAGLASQPSRTLALMLLTLDHPGERWLAPNVQKKELAHPLCMTRLLMGHRSSTWPARLTPSPLGPLLEVLR